MLDLLGVHINIDTAQTIDNFAQSLISYGYKIRNIHIQVHVQHLNCLLRSAVGISCVNFLIRIGTDIQIGITIYADQLDITGIHVNTGDHNAITSAALVQLAFLSRIYAEQCDVHIALHGLVLLYFFGNPKFFGL